MAHRLRDCRHSCRASLVPGQIYNSVLNRQILSAFRGSPRTRGDALLLLLFRCRDDLHILITRILPDPLLRLKVKQIHR